MSRFYPRNIASRRDLISQGKADTNFGGGEQSVNDQLEREQLRYGYDIYRGGTVVACGDLTVGEVKVSSGDWDIFFRYTNEQDTFVALTTNIRSTVYGSVSSVGIPTSAMSLSRTDARNLRLHFAGVESFNLTNSIAAALTLPAAIFDLRSQDFAFAGLFTITNTTGND